MPPQTIDEVLSELDQIILRARNEQSRLGYFATLYRNVTIKVKQGIAAGLFADGARMEKFDVTFANRYLLAMQSFRGGDTTREDDHSVNSGVSSKQSLRLRALSYPLIPKLRLCHEG